jgi:3-hydroxyacyl-CoA dehydrogenase
MKLTETKIAVLGSGLMGHGITQVAAQFGKYEVSTHLAVELKRFQNTIIEYCWLHTDIYRAHAQKRIVITVENDYGS